MRASSMRLTASGCLRVAVLSKSAYIRSSSSVERAISASTRLYLWQDASTVERRQLVGVEAARLPGCRGSSTLCTSAASTTRRPYSRTNVSPSQRCASSEWHSMGNSAGCRWRYSRGHARVDRFEQTAAHHARPVCHRRRVQLDQQRPAPVDEHHRSGQQLAHPLPVAVQLSGGGWEQMIASTRQLQHFAARCCERCNGRLTGRAARLQSQGLLSLALLKARLLLLLAAHSPLPPASSAACWMLRCCLVSCVHASLICVARSASMSMQAWTCSCCSFSHRKQVLTRFTTMCILGVPLEFILLPMSELAFEM